jgi:hypothetical protein
VTPAALAVPRKVPWSADQDQSTLSCLQVISEKEWEHHRSKVRDLDRLEVG